MRLDFPIYITKYASPNIWLYTFPDKVRRGKTDHLAEVIFGWVHPPQPWCLRNK